jgi:hypothetical protein
MPDIPLPIRGATEVADTSVDKSRKRGFVVYRTTFKDDSVFHKVMEAAKAQVFNYGEKFGADYT